MVYLSKVNCKNPSKSYQDMLESNKVVTMQKFTRLQFLEKTHDLYHNKILGYEFIFLVL